MNTRRRNWVKIWVNEWLRGTVRFELTPQERAIFIDLITLAGDSRIPGIICSGVDEEALKTFEGSDEKSQKVHKNFYEEKENLLKEIKKFLGVPLNYLAVTLHCSNYILKNTLNKLQQTNRIVVDVKQKKNLTLYTIAIVNWHKYQSEYDRQKNYRIDSQKCLENKENSELKVTTDSYNQSYNQSYNSNNSESYNNGYNQSYTNGYNQGDTKSYTKSYNDGYTKSYSPEENRIDKNRLYIPPPFNNFPPPLKMGGDNTKIEREIFSIFCDTYQKVKGVTYPAPKSGKRFESQIAQVRNYICSIHSDINDALKFHKHMCYLYLLEDDADNPDNQKILRSNHSFGQYVSNLSRWAQEAREIPLLETPEDILKYEGKNPPDKLLRWAELLKRDGYDEKQILAMLAKLNKKMMEGETK